MEIIVLHWTNVRLKLNQECGRITLRAEDMYYRIIIKWFCIGLTSGKHSHHYKLYIIFKNMLILLN